MSKHSMICAGIDTGKRQLDGALTPGSQHRQVDNVAEGHSALSNWLRKHRVKRVGIEASGGYEQAVVGKLRRDRFVVIVLQPAQAAGKPHKVAIVACARKLLIYANTVVQRGTPWLAKPVAA